MAPLDDMSGDRILAEFEEMIRGTGGLGTGRHNIDQSRGLVPERRAVNWVNALAALAREIEERYGPHHAELLLRKVGARMGRELLTPLPSARDDFEPAINRALSILDWGWVAVLDRQDTIVFEHRPPWPFENRLDHLPFVLEGFYTDTLHRLSNDNRMQVRMTGSRGGALVFKWLPVDASERPANAAPPSVVVPSPPRAAAPPAERQPEPEPDEDEGAPLALSDAEFDLATELEDVVLDEVPYTPHPVEDRRLPPLTEMRRTSDVEPRMPLTPHIVPARAAPSAARVLLVAATVFIVLFGLGVATSGALMQRLDRLVTANAHSGAAVSDLQARAMAGDTDAQIRLGLQLANNSGAKPDYAGAAHWFEAAAKSGSLEAQYDLGVMTADGLGVKRDPIGAAILFMNAAAGAFPQAEYRIGAAYQDGAGVPRSATFAAMWYERAARHGVRQAQFALAGLYTSGDGVPVDPVQAFAWYRLAEEEGDRAATSKRVELYRGMTMAQREAAMGQAKTLIGDVSGAAELTPQPAHPTVDRLIARAS